jgi:hypothetical protein
MEDEDKNHASQTNISNNQNSSENDTNKQFDDKNSDEFRPNENQQKIKINEQKLKDAKEKTMEIKSDSNKDQNIAEEINQKNTNNLYLHENRYYFKITRCLGGKRKKLMIIISLIISAIFSLISVADIINYAKNIFNNDKLLMNITYIFIVQMIYVFCLLIFQIMIIISERKDNLIINLVFLIVISVIIIFKIFIFIKSSNSKQIIIINFLICFCMTLINIILLLITLRIIKMKKHEQQNIEEIINFTDIPQGVGAIKINDKKDNQLILNNSGTENKSETDQKNKDGISGLVEEINNKENEINNNEQN